MSRVLLFVLLLLVALAQYTVLPRYAPLGLVPDILFVALFFRFLRCSLQEALVWIFILGVVLDVLALDRLGSHALAMVPLAVAAQPLRVRPWLVNPVSCTVLVAMAGLFHSLFLGLTRGGISIIDTGLQLGWQIILTLAIYWVYRRFYKR